tara:strand:- start:564 stop:1175 length:612 start_codon:yes stop_codon:yes gene_type:complete
MSWLILGRRNWLQQPINENFSETGVPTSRHRWYALSAPDWDSTSHATLDGQAVDCVAGSFAVDFVADDFYVKFNYEGGNIASERYLAYIREGPGLSNDLGVALKQTAAEKMRMYINGGVRTASSAFTLLVSTKYYVWMDYKISGLCYVGISTIDSKPTTGTDTATAWADTATDTTGVTMGSINCVDSTGVSWFDNLQVDASAL